MTGRFHVLGLVLAATCASAAVPNLDGGTWQAVDPPHRLHTLDGEDPPLLPAARAVYEKNIAAYKAGDRAFDTTDKCLPPGLPRLLYMNAPFEFQQRADQIAIFYQWDRLARFVDMDVPHGKSVGRVYDGESTGKWENGELVIDSINFKGDTVLDAAGMPHSDALHVIEKYRPGADGRSMTVRLTIDDPKVFSAPWDTQLRLRHDPDGRIQDATCVDRRDLHWGKVKDGVVQQHELIR